MRFSPFSRTDFPGNEFGEEAVPHGFAERHAFSCDPVTGYSHLGKGMPCEDAAIAKNRGAFSFAAVSDGHGTTRCARSRIGSRLAVESALASCEGFFARLCESTDEDVRLASVVASFDLLRRNILLNWRSKVGDHLKEHPYTGEGDDKVPREPYLSRYLAGNELVKLYGATLSFVAMTDTFWLAGQLGDGSVFIRTELGFVNLFPDEDDIDDIGVSEVVDSLCENDAINKFKMAFGTMGKQQKEMPPYRARNVFRYVGISPIAMIVNSDGIEKSYPDDFALGRFYEGAIRILVARGIEAGTEILQSRLPDLSMNGSLDDLAFGGIINMTADWSSVPDFRATSRAADRPIVARGAKGEGNESGESGNRAKAEAMLEDLDSLPILSMSKAFASAPYSMTYRRIPGFNRKKKWRRRGFKPRKRRAAATWQIY